MATGKAMRGGQLRGRAERTGAGMRMRCTWWSTGRLGRRGAASMGVIGGVGRKCTCDPYASSPHPHGPGFRHAPETRRVSSAALPQYRVRHINYSNTLSVANWPLRPICHMGSYALHRFAVLILLRFVLLRSLSFGMVGLEMSNRFAISAPPTSVTI